MKINNRKQNNDNQLYIFCVDTLSVRDIVLSCSFFIEKIKVIYQVVEIGMEEIEKKLNKAFGILFEEMIKIKDVF